MSLRKIGTAGRQLASYATVASRASIQPIAHPPGSGVRFGAVVQGVNVNKISGKEPWLLCHPSCFTLAQQLIVSNIRRRLRPDQGSSVQTPSSRFQSTA